MQNYILDGHAPRLVDQASYIRWRVANPEGRRVLQDMVGSIHVSTIFLGLDHSFGMGGPPILFETMVFGGPLDMECERYATWDAAVVGHAEMLVRVKAGGVSDDA